MHEAKISARKEVVLWGTGTPRREFLYSDDLAQACLFLMNLDQNAFDSLVVSESDAPLINIGSGQDQTIRELAALVAEVVGFGGRLTFDAAKPDGTPRKLLDSSVLSSLGWAPKTNLREGLQRAYRDFLEFRGVSTVSAPETLATKP
jgi:GDP-L-fucose synthase